MKHRRTHSHRGSIRGAWLAPAAALLLGGCSQIESLPSTPPQTPETWLAIQPYLELSIGSTRFLVVQPSTSAIVYALGLLGVAAGILLLHRSAAPRARRWWGVALILWGLGALLAGTSYEAFSYQIKCAGWEVCRWTSVWEIGYLLSSVASVDAILVAQAYACALGKSRRRLITYAAANLALYGLAVLIGSLVPVRFLISFEFLLVATAPSIVLLFVHNLRRYRQQHLRLDLALLGAWVWLGMTIGAYFLYFAAGLTPRLWARGIWFSENDVLHLGLIGWMVYVAAVLAPRLEDARHTGAPLPTE